MADEPMPEERIVQMFRQMVDALHYVHANRILHRDLKTANVFLMRDGTVKLGDFGISKVVSTAKNNMSLVGTPYYISPGRFVCRRRTDELTMTEICQGRQYDAKACDATTRVCTAHGELRATFGRWDVCCTR